MATSIQFVARNLRIALVLATVLFFQTKTFAAVEVFYEVLGARTETPTANDWIDYGTINASSMSAGEAQKQVNKAIERAFNDGAKKVKVRRKVTFSNLNKDKPIEDLGEVSRGKGLDLSIFAGTESSTKPNTVKPIDKPEIKSADPGPMKKTESAALSIVGKEAKGTIGKYSVTFRFMKKGKLIISGEMQGEGKWEQLGDNLYLTTERATYRGTIVGNSISGRRFSREDSQTLDQWAATLEENKPKIDGDSSKLEKKVDVAANSVAGTKWTVEGDESGQVYEFKEAQANGKGSVLRNYGTRQGYEGEWTQVGDKVTYEFRRPDNGSLEWWFEGTVKDGKITGVHHTYSLDRNQNRVPEKFDKVFLKK